MTKSRRATRRFLARLPRAALRAPRTQSRWSIKDVLAHIIGWEDEGTRRLRLIAAGQGGRLRFFVDKRSVDRFNARAVARARRVPLARLWQRADRVRWRLIAALRRVPAAWLNDRSHPYPVVVWLPEFAWTHERDHLRRIRAWWRRAGARALRRAAAKEPQKPLARRNSRTTSFRSRRSPSIA